MNDDMCVITVHGMEGTENLCPTAQDLAVPQLPAPVPTFSCCALDPAASQGGPPIGDNLGHTEERPLLATGFGICIPNCVGLHDTS